MNQETVDQIASKAAMKALDEFRTENESKSVTIYRKGLESLWRIIIVLKIIEQRLGQHYCCNGTC